MRQRGASGVLRVIVETELSLAEPDVDQGLVTWFEVRTIAGHGDENVEFATVPTRPSRWIVQLDLGAAGQIVITGQLQTLGGAVCEFPTNHPLTSDDLGQRRFVNPELFGNSAPPSQGAVYSPTELIDELQVALRGVGACHRPVGMPLDSDAASWLNGQAEAGAHWSHGPG
jgi:hypothetical protein